MNVVEFKLTVTVEAGKDWNYKIADALRNVASEVYLNPQYQSQKGDGSNFIFEYTTKGVER